MFRIEIPTDVIARAVDTAEAPAGPAIAEMLRAIANRIEDEVQIVPWPGGDPEWKPETYRHAQRINDVLVGAVYYIEKD